MANSGDRFRADLPGHDEIDLLFGTANPRSDRANCLSRDELGALVRRTGGLDDPGYVHLTECSACYNEFRALQEIAHEQARRTRAALWWVGAAAVILVGAAAWLYVRSAPVPTTTGAEVRLRLDLRPYAATRGGRGQDMPPPLVLARERLDLTVLLPVGSEPGPYDLRLIDASSHVLASASASAPAEIRDFVTTLHASLDLSAVPRGNHRLAVRRAGESWAYYPAVLQ